MSRSDVRRFRSQGGGKLLLDSLGFRVWTALGGLPVEGQGFRVKVVAAKRKPRDAHVNYLWSATMLSMKFPNNPNKQTNWAGDLLDPGHYVTGREQL